MAENGVEIARAFVTLIPSFEGAQSKITEQLLPSAEVAAAGTKSGGLMATNFGTKFKAALAPLLSGAVIAGAFKGLYEVGSTFDKVTDTIRVGTGATGDALRAMAESAKNVGKTVPTTFQEAATSIADWNTRMGLSGQALEKVAAQTEMLKSMDMAADINTLSGAFSVFNITGDQTVSAMDTLFRVSQATGVSMDSLAGGVKQAAPALQQLGFSFEESASLAGLLDKAGLNASQVMASMSKGLVTLAKDGEAPQAAFKRVTSEIQRFIDQGNDVAALDLAGKIFGTRGATQMIAAIKESSLSLDDLVGSANLTQDTILGVGQETQDFAEKWQLVKNNAQAALEPLASAVFDGLNNALSTMLPYLESLGAWLGENPAVLAGLAATIGTLLVGAFVSWAGSIVAVNVALLANPITWVVAGVAALTAGIVALWHNWESVAGWLTGVWSSVVDGVGSVFSGLGELLSSTGDSIAGSLSSTWETVSTATATAWESVSSTVSTGVGNVVSWVSGLPGRSAEALSSLGSSIAGVASSAWEAFKGATTTGAQAVITFVTGIPGKILSVFSGFGTLLYESGRSLLKGLWSGISSMVGWISSKVSGVVSTIRSYFPFSPAKQGPFSGKGWVLYSGMSIGRAFADGIAASAGSATSAAERMMSDAKAALTPGTLGADELSARTLGGLYRRVEAKTEPENRGTHGGVVVNIGSIVNPLEEPSSVSVNKELQRAAALAGGLI